MSGRGELILQAHPTGNAFVRNLAEALVEEGLLGEFWTGLDYPARDQWLRWLPASVRAQLQRRRLPVAVKPYAHLRPWRELGRLLGPRVGLRGRRWTARQSGTFSVDAVYRDLDRVVAKRVERAVRIGGVYLYEDGAEAAFEVARARGVRTFYDLPIGYWKAARVLLTEEAERMPEWAETMPGNRDSVEKCARKDRELALADVVVVASTFTERTLALAPEVTARVVRVPYGAPLGLGRERRPMAAGGKLKVLFVGSLGQRKGTAYLLEAMERVGGAAELTLLGTRPAGRCGPLDAALRKHRWIPSCPHEQVLAEMAAHDVLVFPSLFEGFGLVILEAMAQGLPVITTANTAGPDVITEGVDGFVVPIRSAEAIAAKLELLAGDRVRLEAMREAAKVAAARFTWARYRRELVALVAGELGKGGR